MSGGRVVACAGWELAAWAGHARGVGGRAGRTAVGRASFRGGSPAWEGVARPPHPPCAQVRRVRVAAAMLGCRWRGGGLGRAARLGMAPQPLFRPVFYCCGDVRGACAALLLLPFVFSSIRLCSTCCNRVLLFFMYTRNETRFFFSARARSASSLHPSLPPTEAAAGSWRSSVIRTAPGRDHDVELPSKSSMRRCHQGRGVGTEPRPTSATGTGSTRREGGERARRRGAGAGAQPPSVRYGQGARPPRRGRRLDPAGVPRPRLPRLANRERGGRRRRGGGDTAPRHAASSRCTGRSHRRRPFGPAAHGRAASTAAAPQTPPAPPSRRGRPARPRRVPHHQRGESSWP